MFELLGTMNLHRVLEAAVEVRGCFKNNLNAVVDWIQLPAGNVGSSPSRMMMRLAIEMIRLNSPFSADPRQ
jgi:hypothetical protein